MKTRLGRRLFLLFVVFVLAVVFGCENPAAPADSPDDIPDDSTPPTLQIDHATLALPVSQTATLSVTTDDNFALPSVTWSSSNSSVASVTAGGIVTGVAPGSAVISATPAEGTAVTCAVTVGYELVVSNIVSGSDISYRLLILDGTGNTGVSTISVTVDDGAGLSWPVVSGTFKASALLDAGANEITLSAANHLPLTLSVTVNEMNSTTNPNYVRPVYVLASDQDVAATPGLGVFDAPSGTANTIAEAKVRLGFATLMMQSMVAEMMNEAGHGRRTFRLPEIDSATGFPEVTVLTLTGPVYRFVDSVYQVLAPTPTVEYLQSLDSTTFDSLWDYLYAQVTTGTGAATKSIAMLGMSHWDATANGGNGAYYASTALGGGQLALFGSLGLHTWPTGPADLVAAFSDTGSPADDALYVDIYAPSSQMWSQASTGIGAALHEIGHMLQSQVPGSVEEKTAIGLVLDAYSHVPDSSSLMGANRGFDFINRRFMGTDGPTTPAAGPATFLDDGMAAYLAEYCDWIYAE